MKSEIVKLQELQQNYCIVDRKFLIPNRQEFCGSRSFLILECGSTRFLINWFLINKKYTLWKADEIVSESEIVSREAAGSTGRKPRQTGRPGEIKTERHLMVPGDLTGPHSRNAFQKISGKNKKEKQ